jgi:two-component system sensor histidine kinase KdpD
LISQAALAIERGLQEQKVRRLRFLEESDKVKNAVLSAISHDVRTPLAAITASLSGLLTSDGALDQAAERQLLETADIEARRLHRLVNNLLSMTRLETGASTVRTEPCDLLTWALRWKSWERQLVSDKFPSTLLKTCLWFPWTLD